MTIAIDDTNRLFKALEPAVAEYVHGHIVYTDRHGVVAALSQAVSLKRIADALEKLTAPPASKALTAEQRATAESYVFPWQDWPGGELPPVPGDIRVEVKFRDGTGSWIGAPAFAWQWRHAADPRDIIAWRLAK